MRIVLSILCVLLSGCASVWPQPRVTWYHAATPEQASQHLVQTFIANPNYYHGNLAGTSNGPAFARRGTRWVLERVKPGRVWTKADKGLIVVWKQSEHMNVAHMIIDVSRDGKAIRTTGLANRHLDPWVPADRVVAILREGVTSL